MFCDVGGVATHQLRNNSSATLCTVLVLGLVERSWLTGRTQPVDWSRSLSVIEVVRMTLIRLRRNSTYSELGADFSVPPQTAWNTV